MNEKFEKFIADSGQIALKPDESRVIRQNLVSFMESRRHIGQETPVTAGRWSRILSVLTLNGVLNKPMPIAIIIILLLGGSVSAAAESSLPGDVLHPIKLEINEKVRAALALSADGKTQWEIRLAERRLEEAEDLSAKTDVEVKTDVMAKIETNFERHAAKVRDMIAKLEAEGKTELAAQLTSRFEASLGAHEEILERLKVKLQSGDLTREEVKDELKNLRQDVKDSREAIKEVRKEREDKVVNSNGAEIAAQAAANMSANVIAQAERFIANAEAKYGADAVVEAKAKLTEAKRVQADAQAKLRAGSFREAFLGFHQAARIAQHAKLLVRANVELKLDARSNTETESKTESRTEADVKVETRGELKLDLR